DLEVELATNIDQKAQEPGAITLPAKKLLDITRSLPGNSMLEVCSESSRAMIKSGKSWFTLAAIPASEFPTIGELEPTLTLCIPSKDLKTIIEHTQFSMAHQDVRYYLNGLMLEIGNRRVRAVATDGHRLALSEVGITVDTSLSACRDTQAAEPLQIVIPRKGVMELSRMLTETSSEAHVLISTNHVQVKLGTRRLVSKLIDGRFPDYGRVLTETGDKVVKANREALRRGLARTSILSNEKFRGVKIILDRNTLRSVAHNPEQEEAEEEIDVEYLGAPLEIGFNALYLLDVLSAIETETVRLEFSGPDKSCLIQPEGQSGSRYVIGPMRL
ncbi:MAG: DNA polymerase III subunit beta, partial [Nitrososphaerales archaeon]